MVLSSALATGVAGIFLPRAEAQAVGAIVLGGAAALIYRRGVQRGEWDASHSVPMWLWGLGVLAIVMLFSSFRASDRSVSETRFMMMTQAGILGIVVAIYRGSEGRAAARWAERRALTLDAGGMAFLRSHLRQRYVVRLVGGAVLAALFVATAAEGIASPGWIILLAFVLSHVEMIASEMTYRIPHDKTTPAASLEVRSVHQHVPRAALRLLRGLAVLNVALAVIAQLAGPDPGAPFDVRLVALVSIAVVLACEIAQRLRVRLPQPYVSDELLRLDEAIRRSWARESLGGALAVLALALGYALWQVGSATDPEWAMSAIHTASLVLGGVLFFYAQYVVAEELSTPGVST